MMAINKPFIGITGVSNLDEVNWLFQIPKFFPEDFLVNTIHTINFGVLISDNTLKGLESQNTLYPPIDLARKILNNLKSSFTSVVHFSSKNNLFLQESVYHLFETLHFYEHNICKTIQFNVLNPAISDLKSISTEFPELNMILQIPLWLEPYQNVNQVIEFIHRYEPYAAYYILDTSAGRGVGFEHDQKILDIFKGIAKSCFLPNRFVFAGGLSHGNVFRIIRKLMDIFQSNSFSIDSQRKLRGGKVLGHKIGNLLNEIKVIQYLTESYRAFKRV
jgi:hypothetical protein